MYKPVNHGPFITLDEDDIYAATPRKERTCAVNWGMRSSLPNATHIRVGKAGIRWVENGYRYRADLPKPLAALAKMFDEKNGRDKVLAAFPFPFTEQLVNVEREKMATRTEAQKRQQAEAKRDLAIQYANGRKPVRKHRTVTRTW